MSVLCVDCAGKEIRQINREIKDRIAEGATEIDVFGPEARHNLGVALLTPITVRFHGSVGYYCAGLSDSPTVHIEGSAGWGVAEGLMSGTVTVSGNAGNGAGAAMRGGTVVVRGDVGARAGASIKGGTLIVGGNTGYMTGFMGQKGTIIVCGDAEPGLGDSMYETIIYIGGEIAELGSDAVVHELTPEETDDLAQLLTPLELGPRVAWKKVVAGRRLWNFDKRDSAWRAIL